MSFQVLFVMRGQSIPDGNKFTGHTTMELTGFYCSLSGLVGTEAFKVNHFRG